MSRSMGTEKVKQHADRAAPGQKVFHVAVIGGGASGTLSAIQLLRLKFPIIVHLFNDGFELGRGVAYSARSSRLVLNVPARNMSAFPDLPSHFIEWLQDKHETRYGSDSFVPRYLYGDYLRETLQAAAKESPWASLRVYNSRITKMVPQNQGHTVFYDNEKVFANAVILALGNVPPANPNLNDGNFLQDDRYITNPWKDSEKIHRICDNGTVVILGAGLTAVDTILQLRQQGYQGKIFLISRRGLWPTVHKLGLSPAAYSPSELKGLSPRQLVQVLRKKVRLVEIQGGDWRQIVDGLRPETNNIWAGWTLQQRRSFLRHLQLYWNVHRHRIPSEVWDFLDQETRSKAVQLRAGRIIAIRPKKDGLAVIYRPRHQQTVQELQSGFVVNCTGSETLQRASRQALVESLLDQKLAQLDPLGHGLATAPDGGLLNSDGLAVPGLYMIGPLRRGKLWETTAIPEIRVQANAIAHEIYRCLTVEKR